MSARQESSLAAIAALADGRLPEAHRLILDLLADPDAPIIAGQCRYCGCSEQRPCAIVIPSEDDANEPILARCSWADDERTVCSNLACVRRYQREQMPAREPEAASRIVRP